MPNPQQVSKLVVIPTYNEIENIIAIIEAILSQEIEPHVLVVDDNSPDGTAEIVRELQKSNPDKIHLLKREGKLGLGTAYIAGFKYGLANNYDYIFEMDADFSHKPKDLNRLYKACVEGADMSIGSRYTKGGGVKNWPMDRLLLSYGASVYVRMITWMWVKDPTAGFICYSRRVLEAMDFSKIRFSGYAFQIEMKYYAYTLGFKIKEVPITFSDREKGESKMNTNIVQEAIKGVIGLRLRAIKGYYSKQSS
jgi:dolichol-phosphate mannosyltransferase